MKTMAFKEKEYKFTADLWTFTTSTDPAGGTLYHYTFNRNINLLLVTGMFGKMNCYFLDSEYDILNKAQLLNVKDAGGVELIPGAIWEVDQFQPYINQYQRREGFKGRVIYVASSVV